MLSPYFDLLFPLEFFARNLNLDKLKLHRSPFSKKKFSSSTRRLEIFYQNFFWKDYRLLITIIDFFSKSIIIKFDNWKNFDYQKYCFLIIYAILRLQYWSEVMKILLIFQISVLYFNFSSKTHAILQFLQRIWDRSDISSFYFKLLEEKFEKFRFECKK